MRKTQYVSRPAIFILGGEQPLMVTALKIDGVLHVALTIASLQLTIDH